MLDVNFLGLKYKNPLLVASAPPSMDGDHMFRAIKAGWGGCVSKTIGLDKDIFPDVRPRLSPNRARGRLYGMQNIELITTHKLDWWVRELEIAKSAGPPLIVSVMAAYNAADWQEIARWAEKHGADAIEMNMSCPHGTTEKGRGMALGQNPEMVENAVKWVKEAVQIPVLAKLTPNVSDIVPQAKAAEKAGVDGLTAINTVLALSGVDIYTGKVQPNVKGHSTMGGNCGPMVRPLGLRFVADIAQNTNLPVSGIGGIDSWENVIEYIMVGATTVQVCTAIMWYGYDIVAEWKKNIEIFMKEYGYSSFEDMRGCALKSLGKYGDLKVDENVVPVVDEDKCTACNRCVVSCRDAASVAIKLEGKAVVDKEKCIGCGLCTIVCPYGAITMIEEERKKERKIPAWAA